MLCYTGLECLQYSIEIVYPLSEPLFNVFLLTISLSLKNIPGRSWLVGFAICSLISSILYGIFYFIPMNYPEYTEYSYAYRFTTRLIYKFGFFILLPVFLFNLWSSKTLNLSAVSILFSWRGRVTRSIYWGAGIANAVLFFAIIDGINLFRDLPTEATWFSMGLKYFTLFIVLGFSMWTNLIVTIKRWHDLNKSGWMTLCLLIPFIGAIGCMIYLGFAKGKKDKNRFGEALIQ
ncbi:DUF805 domain-containing protein [Pseudoalteromonas sp. Z9A5]|uniref:DUF805 domain-containing protein n=1 Tax=Pseudoalteromonas sp. Z9A5 TaxID=2686355 RepID=UPI001407378A|nr:DUF805 domain-containing protein [Pseudoalteromonas sp. Z9A5]